MAGELIGALRVTLSADTAEFSEGLRRAERTAVQSSRRIERAAGGIGRAVAGAAAGIVSVLAVDQLVQLGRRALDYASSLGEVSQRLGVTTRDLQVLRYAASQTGVSQGELDRSLERLTVTLGKVAVGAQAPTKALAAIGLSARDVANKDTGEAFRLIAEQLSRVADRSKRAAVEVALFGESGAKLDTLLSQGREGINALADAAERLGIVLSDEQIQKADETADKLEAMKKVLEARIAGVVADNADSILALANALANLTSSILSFFGSNPEKALGIIGALGGGVVGARFGPWGAAIGALAGGIQGARTGADIRQSALDASMDPQVRRQELHRARDEFRRLEQMQGNLRGLKREPPALRAARTEWERQIRLANQAAAAITQRAGAPAAVAPAPGMDVDKFLARSPRGGRGGRDRSAEEAERLRQKMLRDAYEYDSDLRRARASELEAQMDLTEDHQERARLQLELLAMDDEQRRASLELGVQLGDIGAAQAEQLNAIEDRVSALKRQAIEIDREERMRRDAARLQQVDLDIRRDLLALQGNLARTARERREIEMRILDVIEAEERLRIEQLKASRDAADQEEGRRREAVLDQTMALQREQVRRQTMGPLETYLDRIPDTANELNEALEGVAANGLQAIEDGLLDVLSGTESVGDAFRTMASQIIAELLRIQIQRAIIAPLLGAVGFGGNGGLGGAVSGLIGANPGLFAGGGLVRGRGGPRSDMVPIRASNGEFVLQASAVRRFGLPLLSAMNEGRLPRFAFGGMVGTDLGVPIRPNMRGVQPTNDNIAPRGGDTHFHFPGVRDAREARVAGVQAASAYRNEIAKASRQGF